MQRYLLCLVVGVVLGLTACASNPSPMEYLQSTNRTVWLDSEVTNSAFAIVKEMEADKLGPVTYLNADDKSVADATFTGPGMITTPTATVEMMIMNGKADFSQHPTRLILEQTDQHPLVSMEAPGNGYSYWTVCIGSMCSGTMANDGADTTALRAHDQQAVASLNWHGQATS